MKSIYHRKKHITKSQISYQTGYNTDNLKPIENWQGFVNININLISVPRMILTENDLIELLDAARGANKIKDNASIDDIMNNEG